jgi:cytochrome c553
MMSLRYGLVSLAALVGLAACHTPDQQAADQSIAGTVHLCSSCHGLTGRSVSPDFPILAGQQTDYLVAQLHAFRDQTRADPHAHTYMWGMAKHLDDQTIAGVAAYFAGQPAVNGVPLAVPSVVGAKIFAEGLDDRGIPACIGCHGEHAEGQGEIPRLAGQHATYLAEQLGHFRSNARSNETMHMNALNLTDGEIKDLADYMASL